MVVGLPAANVNDVQALRPLLLGIRPSAHAAALADDVPTRSGPTRRTTLPATWRGCANATSLHGSPGRAWSPPNASEGTDGRFRERSHGSSDSAA
ncbi:hypothetical protein [Streptomyces tendae]|uniref:hypothetical protein n=1 Tax=Streptomyces tendae TaxID=1932 RepID=UPI0036C27080